MSSFVDFLVAACDPAPGWIENQIKYRRKVGLVGKYSQLLDKFQNPSKDTSGWTMDIWLAIVDETKVNVDNERILQLVWPDSPPKLNLIEDDLWTWAWYKSLTVPNLKIWLYQYHSDSSQQYRNSLERGIVHSIKDTDDALTTMDKANNSATTFYVSPNMDSPTPWKVTMPSLNDHLLPDSLTLQCYTTPTASVRLPIRLS